MNISHKITNISGEDIIHIYITVEDIYEFGKENLGKGKDTNLLTKLREYIENNLSVFKKATAVIVINGVVIGTIALAGINPNIQAENNTKPKKQVEVYTENKETVDDVKKKEEHITQDVKKEDKEDKKEESKKQNTTNSVPKKQTATVSKNKNTTKTSSSTNKTTTSSKKPSTTTNKTNTTASNKTSTSTSNKTNTTTQTSGIKINFNNGGVVSKIDLEEYVIGVVAAEMPASFHTEALKAQAVTARTYAMKKHSQGVTLVNSTSHQVYNSVSQMKSKWGSSYSTYYNKIKNAVDATKGKVLKYNGEYIEASYFSMSNGSTELPSYVWNRDYPYLQVVSSPWDENISSGKYTTTINYTTASNKLGVTVNSKSKIEVLSKTAGGRVNKISIAGKTFTGVKVRTLLGLRSADFEIVQKESGLQITTHGFGHGVGMSQYGANGAAKAGYTYKQILNHYYKGASLVNI